MNPPQTPAHLVVLLGVLIALPALGTDLYVPALPVLARSLSTDVAAAQFTLTTYFIGLAAGMLLWGPLSDRFGRRPVLLCGLGLMLACSAWGSLADSIASVSLARFGQGLAMSSGAVMARSIVRDLHAYEQAARLLATMTIIFSLVPIAAPLAGAALAGSAGWRAVLAAMGFVAAILLVAVARALPETAPVDRRSAHPFQVILTFAMVLRERRFITPFVLILCCHIGILAWVSSSAFVLIRGSGVSTLAYGGMFSLVMCGQIAGAWCSRRFVLGYGIGRMLRLGATVMGIAGIAAGLLAWLGQTHWLAIVLPFMGFLFGTALIVSNATALALSPFPAAAGSASSLLGAIGFTIGAAVSSLLGLLFDGTARPMSTAAAVAGVAAFVLHRAFLNGKT